MEEPEEITHEYLINQAARALARDQGWDIPEGYDFFQSENPRAAGWKRMAEVAFEAITGDTPDYSS